MIWGNAFCQSYILWTLIFRKTIAHKIGILLLCDQEYGRKKSIRAFYATFMLWYCLVSINFLFQEVSMTVSYKTFRSCWCQLNHSQRDVNCCKGLHRRVLQWLTQVSSSICSCQAAVTCSGPWCIPGTDTGHGCVPTVWAHSWAPNTGIRTLKYSLRCWVRKVVPGKSTKNTNAAVKRNGRGILCVKKQTINWGSQHEGDECWTTVFKRNINTGLKWAHKAQWHCSAQPALAPAFILSLKSTQVSADLDYKHMAQEELWDKGKYPEDVTGSRLHQMEV